MSSNIYNNAEALTIHNRGIFLWLPIIGIFLDAKGSNYACIYQVWIQFGFKLGRSTPNWTPLQRLAFDHTCTSLNPRYVFDMIYHIVSVYLFASSSVVWLQTQKMYSLWDSLTSWLVITYYQVLVITFIIYLRNDAWTEWFRIFVRMLPVLPQYMLRKYLILWCVLRLYFNLNRHIKNFVCLSGCDAWQNTELKRLWYPYWETLFFTVSNEVANEFPCCIQRAVSISHKASYHNISKIS